MSFSAPRKFALVAALEREVGGLLENCSRVEREHQGRKFLFFERDAMVIVCGGIGMEAARRAAEAVIALYQPALVHSVGFAGALHADLHVGDIFSPSVVVDSRDGSRATVAGGDGVLITFMTVADTNQKARLAKAYGARVVDMEAAAVAASAQAHGIPFGATKVISDELTFEMPESVRFIDAHGHFKTSRFVIFAAVRPWLWSGIATLARNTHKAARALDGHLKSFRPHLSEVIEAGST